MDAALELFALDPKAVETLGIFGLKHLRDRLRSRVPAAVRPVVRPWTFGMRARSCPISEEYGWDRGTPIDRVYIERFLTEHRGDIRGRVLEVKDATYTSRLGLGVERIDILDIDAANERATIVADLADIRDGHLASFDCFLLTQTLQYVPAIEQAVANAHRLLAPGGVVLATVPCLGRVTDDHYLADHWRFTPRSVRELFAGSFGDAHVTVRSYGNSVAAAGFVLGYAAEDLRRHELETHDARYPVIVAVRAAKALASPAV